ncbi:MAG TPA: HAD family hydrolase [Bryobacteraceae bacterium]|nr:HAD family hydrolase [Bryobacteraceae bacterium]
MLENITPGASARDARVVLFDFDGTLSLIRSGWMNVMVPMMVEILLDLKTGESEDELRAVVEEFVWKLTGKETIYQMMAFADAVAARGGQPLQPLEYKKMYLDRLWQKIESRVQSLQKGQADPEDFLVPGSRELLERLKDRGLKMYLASGTDEIYMKEEARLLGVTQYFDGGVYGALDDYKSFSKAILIQRILSSAEFHGHQFLGFGDGYVEIEEVKSVGGVAVGVASEEPACTRIDEWKRRRLIGVGADYIVPNYLCREELFSSLFPA